jgi:hypothetical protein
MKAQRKLILAAGTTISIISLGILSHVTPTRLANIIPKAQADEGGTCSVHNLKGVYGIQFEGIRLSDNAQYVSVSLMSFDGKGTFTVKEIGRINGQPVNRTFTGPYIVKSDCSGFVDYSSNLTTPPHQAHGAFVIVEQGQTLFFLDDEDNWAARGTGKKL